MEKLFLKIIESRLTEARQFVAEYKSWYDRQEDKTSNDAMSYLMFSYQAERVAIAYETLLNDLKYLAAVRGITI
jgi:hypothetical protein